MMRWIRSRIDLKLMVPLGPVFLLVLGGVLYLSVRSERARFLARHLEQSAGLTAYLAADLRDDMARGMHETVAQRLHELGTNVPDARVFVLGDKRTATFATAPGDAGLALQALPGGEPVHRAVEEALARGVPEQSLVEPAGDAPSQTVIRAVENGRACVRCHGAERKVLGVVVLRRSLAGMVDGFSTVTQAGVLIGVGGLGIMVALTFLILSVLVTRPLHRVVAAAEKVGMGDLSVGALPVHADDEVGSLARAFNGMVARLREIISGMAPMAAGLAAATAEISNAAAAAEDQASKTAQLATASEEMSTSMIGVAKNASAIADEAHESDRIAKTGSEAVVNMMNGMKRISAASVSSAATIGELEARSARIGQVAAVIDDVTQQTRILACNAAIEAARAGEHGKGFAVVADEVRSLANSTSKSTKEIREILDALRADAVRASESIRAVNRHVEEGLALAGGAATSLAAIVASANRVTGMISQIATATEEQSTVAEDISRNVESIAGSARTNSSGVSQVSGAVRDLAAQTAGVNRFVSLFKLGDGTPAGGSRLT